MQSLLFIFLIVCYTPRIGYFLLLNRTQRRAFGSLTTSWSSFTAALEQVSIRSGDVVGPKSAARVPAFLNANERPDVRSS